VTDKSANKMWGGRFKASPSEIMEEINASIDVDKRLAAQDIRGSKAHAEMLSATGIITKADGARIQKGLDQVLLEIESGRFEWKSKREDEDIHMAVERRLTELVGEAGKRLHTARSRNDQVATDFRLYIRDWIDGADEALATLQAALAVKAEEHCATIMPGFTHLQPAQPITFGHHLLAYVEMLARDRGRLDDARRRLNECPLGSAALAGTSFPIDRKMTAGALGFDRPMANSLDGVSDRDFALETLAAAAIAATHLSRLAEEIVIWMSPQFGLIRLSDAFTTGSSIMPQKRNPDAAELVRAKTGRIAGAFQSLLVVLKGLPLAYSKDLQEDKEITFGALDSLRLALAAMTGMVRDLEPDAERMAKAAGLGHATATDLANWLVEKKGFAFRDAHHITGRAVASAEEQGIELDKLSLSELQAIEPSITVEAKAELSIARSVRRRTSYGGTAPQNVLKMARSWLKRLEKERGTG